MGTMEELDKLYQQYQEDPRFSHLRRVGRNFVPGVGFLNPKVLIIGEAPGKMENAYKIPFVGRAGKNLSLLLNDVGIKDENVFYTNTVKYYPLQQSDGNFTPVEDEIVASREYLLKEIEIVSPLVVGMCGRAAIHTVFPELNNVFHNHGELLKDKFVPLYHPAVLTYQPYRKALVTEGYIKLAAYATAKSAA